MADQGSNKSEEKVVTHPLLAREVRPDHNWHELMENWRTATIFGGMESVLHRGFKVSLDKQRWDEKEYDHIDRLIFYFSIADGWAGSSWDFKRPEDGGSQYETGDRDSTGIPVKKSQSELRQNLALKAFEMLCLNFFKMELCEDRDGDFNWPWIQYVVSDRLFPVIQNFFRAEHLSDNKMSMRNLSGHREDRQSHNERRAIGFLLNLARFLWGWKEPDTSHYPNKAKTDAFLAATRVRVEAAKPWMIEVLASLDKLDLLRGWTFEFDEACISKLKEIALRSEISCFHHPVSKDRLVVSLDEACYLGSKAAWFLRERELRMREHKRLSAILEAEQAKAEADREIKRLTGKK